MSSLPIIRDPLVIRGPLLFSFLITRGPLFSSPGTLFATLVASCKALSPQEEIKFDQEEYTRFVTGFRKQKL